MTRISDRSRAFSLVEMALAGGIVALLAVLLVPALSRAGDAGRVAKSLSNLRQLATANLAYAADNDGHYCPAQEPRNLVRWHGARTSISGAFDPKKGFLAPYLGEEGRVKLCPLFQRMLTGAQSFENSTGGYGYNATYIGGTPQDTFQSRRISQVPSPGRTVMFATTAFARSGGVQEYAYAEPYQWVDPNDQLSGALQPSVHFRAGGRALVAWCDGHVTAEAPSGEWGDNYYGGNNQAHKIGWFGPSRDNGYWNPNFVPHEGE